MARAPRRDAPASLLPRYRISGLTFESELALTAIPRETQAVEPAFRVVMLDETARSAAPSTFSYERQSDGSPFLSVGETRDGYWLRAHDLADFTLDPTGSVLGVLPGPHCDATTTEQLLVDVIFPLFLLLHGHLSLHASAVAIDNSHVIGFAASAGSGKSTTAALLSERHQIVSDDCLSMFSSRGSPHVDPSYPSVRLRQESAEGILGAKHGLKTVSPRTTKLRFDRTLAGEGLPLTALFLLKPSLTRKAPTARRLSKREGLLELCKHVHRLDPAHRVLLAHEHRALGNLVESTPVFELENPHDFAQAPALCALIERIASEVRDSVSEPGP